MKPNRLAESFDWDHALLALRDLAGRHRREPLLPAPPGGLVALLSSREAFDALRGAWDELYAAAGGDNVFLTHAWTGRWMDAFGGRPLVALLRRGEQLLAAMVLEQQDGVLAMPDEHTYWGQILARPGTALDALFSGLARRGHRRLELHGSACLDERRALEQAAARAYAVVPRHLYVTRSIAVPSSLAEYLAQRAGKVRSELKRKIRRLEREQPGVALVRCDGPGTQAWSLVAEVEKSSWKSEAGTSITYDSAEGRFYRGLVQEGDATLRPRTYALVKDGRALAYALGVIHGSRYYAFKTSYRASLQALSPGLVLFCRILEDLAAERHVAHLELLGQDSRFKRELATNERPWCNYELRTSSLLARSYAAAYRELRASAQRIVVSQTARRIVRWLHRAQSAHWSASAEEDEARRSWRNGHEPEAPLKP